MLVTIKGIVLKSIQFDDYDKLVTVLTEEGKLFFKAKGIRSLTSKNAAGCRSFVYAEFVLDRRGEKCFLRKATPLYSTVKTGSDIETFALASYFAELCEDTALDAETGKSALKLLMNALFILSKEDRPPELVKAIFELRLLAAHGFMPLFDACAVCGKSAEEITGKLAFRFLDGDFCCLSCLSRQDENYIKVSKSVMLLAKRSISCGESEAYAVRIPADMQKEFSYFCERFLLAQLDKKYNTLEFYKEVKNLPEAKNGETNGKI